MTWAGIKSSGRGKLAMRLSIDGIPYEFVTDGAMEQTAADDRIRVAGLRADSITWGERVDPVAGTFESDGFSVEIVERQSDLAVTKALAYEPTKVVYLTADLAVAGTTITVGNTTGFSADDYIHIGTEAIKVGGTTSTTFTGCTRAQWNTVDQAHFTQDGAALSFPAVSDRPLGIEGRRARLYLYGEGDDLTGNGNLVWMGVVASDAKLGSDGTTWSFHLDGMSTVLQGDLGTDLDEPVRPRGYYFPQGFGPRVIVRERGAATNTANFNLVGFFEDMEAFVNGTGGLNASADFSAFDTVTGGGDLQFVTDGPDSFRLQWRTRSSNAVRIDFSINWLSATASFFADTFYGTSSTTPVSNFDVASSTTYKSSKVTFGPSLGVLSSVASPVGWNDPEEAGTTEWPANRIYVDGDVSAFTLVGCTVDWGSAGQSYLGVDSVDDANRFVSGADNVGLARYWGFDQEEPPEIYFRRVYALAGNLSDFRNDLTTNAPALANKGIMPMVTTADLESWTTVVARAAQGRQHVSARQYAASGSISLEELVAGDCQLLGTFPHTAATQKITLSQFKIPLATDPADYTLDGSAVLVDRGFPQWEWIGDGTVNTITFETKWNGKEYDGAPVTIRDIASIGQHRKARDVSISPKSFNFVEPAIDVYVNIARPVLAAYGGRYAYVMLDVAMTVFGLEPGDVVSITHPTLPNPLDGTRGLTGVKGLVIGRWWEPMNARGRVLAYVNYDRYAGYSPSWEVSSENNTAGDTWELTVTSTLSEDASTDMSQSGEDSPSSHFAAGDQIEVYRWDSSSATVVGEVDSVAGSVVTVTFDATWTPGADTWILRYDDATDVVAGQENYVHISGTDHLVDYSSGAETARVLA